MITLTRAAVQELQRLCTQTHPDVPVAIRLTLQPGGSCGQWAYQFEFGKAPLAADQIIEQDGLQLALDVVSQPHLHGLTIDYTEDLMGGAFRFNNPQAAHTCGCGHAFTVRQ